MQKTTLLVALAVATLMPLGALAQAAKAQDHTVVSYLCEGKKPLTVTYSGFGKDATARAAVEGRPKTLHLDAQASAASAKVKMRVFKSGPYVLKVDPARDLRKAGNMSVAKLTQAVADSGQSRPQEKLLFTGCQPR